MNLIFGNDEIKGEEMSLLCVPLWRLREKNEDRKKWNVLDTFLLENIADKLPNFKFYEVDYVLQIVDRYQQVINNWIENEEVK